MIIYHPINMQNDPSEDCTASSSLHICSVCFKKFSSGKALGGHKNAHRVCSAVRKLISVMTLQRRVLNRESVPRMLNQFLSSNPSGQPGAAGIEEVILAQMHSSRDLLQAQRSAKDKGLSLRFHPYAKPSATEATQVKSQHPQNDNGGGPSKMNGDQKMKGAQLLDLFENHKASSSERTITDEIKLLSGGDKSAEEEVTSKRNKSDVDLELKLGF